MHKNEQLFPMRPSYGGLYDLIDYISQTHNTKNYSLIEIGSYAGESTTFFAKYFDSVISIDPFINNYDPQDPTCQYMPLDNVYHKYLQNISLYTNIKHIRQTSDMAIDTLSTMLVDYSPVLMVYIDGLHTLEQVSVDIQNYYPLIIADGYLCGHDYNNQNCIGVSQAVNSFHTPHKIFNDSSWLIKKCMIQQKIMQ